MSFCSNRNKYLELSANLKPLLSPKTIIFLFGKIIIERSNKNITFKNFIIYKYLILKIS